MFLFPRSYMRAVAPMCSQEVQYCRAQNLMRLCFGW